MAQHHMTTTTATTTTMSTRGRVVIPKPVRDRAGLQAGDTVTLQPVGDAIEVRRRPEPSVVSFHQDADGFYAWLDRHAPDGFFLVVGKNTLHRARLCVHFGNTTREALCAIRLDDLIAFTASRGIEPRRCLHCVARGLTDDDAAHAWFARTPREYPKPGP